MAQLGNKPEYLIVHHTATSRDRTTFGAVNNYHRKLWNFKSTLGYYCGYHYFITADGTITHARAENEVGAHTRQQRMNWRSIAICLTGNFDNEEPTSKQKESLAVILSILMAKYGIPRENIVPHRHFAPKSCFGKRLPDDWASKLVINGNRELVALLEDINRKSAVALRLVRTLLQK